MPQSPESMQNELLLLRTEVKQAFELLANVAQELAIMQAAFAKLDAAFRRECNAVYDVEHPLPSPKGLSGVEHHVV